MQIKVLLPTETLTVDLKELKELVRQGVVQPSTLIEVGNQRGKAKNIPALKPLFAELDAQTQEPPKVTPPTEPQTPSFRKSSPLSQRHAAGSSSKQQAASSKQQAASGKRQRLQPNALL